MASKLHGGVLLVLITCIVCPISSEYSVRNSHHNYNSEKLIQHEITSFDAAQNQNTLIDNHGEILFDELKWFTAENLLPVLIGMLNNNDALKCIGDLFYVTDNIQSPWGLKMLDSFGKPERGVLKGNVRWMGEFDECLETYVPAKENSTVIGDFHGRYCNLQMTVNLFGRTLPLTIGSCIPDSCDSSVGTLNDILNITTNTMLAQYNITEMKLTCTPVLGKLSPAAIFVIFLLSIFILIALIGSLITTYKYFAETDTYSVSDSEQKQSEDIDMQSVDSDIQDRRHNRLPNWIDKVNPFFNCFCLITNGAKLLDTSNSEGQLPCLHGIRFLSLSWVIMCHVFGIVMYYSREVGTILPLLDHWPFQIMMNGFFSVDSFFLLGGFLLAYLYFKGASKNNGKIPWIYFYVHRYVRITPVMMIIMASYTTIYPYLSSGPLWTISNPVCENHWWHNVLYITNFFDEGCMGWTWYLANDMQFFIISPLFLITLFRYPSVGITITTLFLVASSVVNFVISYVYKLPSGLGNIFGLDDPFKFAQGPWGDYTNLIYIKPYTRIGPYLVGIALAYYLYRRRQNNGGKNSMVFLSAGWLIASTLTLACVFGLYHRDMSNIEAGIYTAFSKTCFALGVSWVMYVCLTDQGGFVNNILSYKLFIPLSRLTYCAYLIHPILMYFYFNSMRSLLDFSYLIMLLFYVSLLVVSYVVAFFTTLLFESPVIRLEKLVRTKFAGK